MRLRAILFLGLLAGCASLETPRPYEPVRFEATSDAPVASSPTGWWALETPWFTLLTDAPLPVAREAVLELSRAWVGLKALFGTARPPHPKPLTAFLLADDARFEALFGPRLWGLARRTSHADQLFLYGRPGRWFASADWRLQEKSSVAQHELAHCMLDRYFESQPRFFAEGMAQYLETFRWVGPRSVELGGANYVAYEGFMRHRTVGMADLTAWKGFAGAEGKETGLYGLAWAFVQYALNQEPARFAAYMQGLAQGRQDAFEAAFPAAEAAQLEGRVFSYIKTGKYLVRAFTVADPVGTVTVRALTPEEARDAQAQLTAASTIAQQEGMK